MSEQQDFYCISCGDVSEIEPIDLSELGPIYWEVVCPSCGMRWRLSIEYYEIEEEQP